MRINRILFPLAALALVGLSRPVAGAAQTAVAVDTTRTDAVQVRVVNNNWQDMRIYAVVDDFRVRLGTVTGLTSETLTLKPAILGPSSQVQLQAVAIGNRFASDVEDVVMFPGDKFEYRIENDIALSFVRRI